TTVLIASRTSGKSREDGGICAPLLDKTTDFCAYTAVSGRTILEERPFGTAPPPAGHPTTWPPVIAASSAAASPAPPSRVALPRARPPGRCARRSHGRGWRADRPYRDRP